MWFPCPRVPPGYWVSSGGVKEEVEGEWEAGRSAVPAVPFEVEVTVVVLDILEEVLVVLAGDGEAAPHPEQRQAVVLLQQVVEGGGGHVVARVQRQAGQPRHRVALQGGTGGELGLVGVRVVGMDCVMGR